MSLAWPLLELCINCRGLFVVDNGNKTEKLIISFFFSLFCFVFVFVCTNVHTLLGSSVMSCRVMSCRVMLCHVVTCCRFMFDVFFPTGVLGVLFRGMRCCASTLDTGVALVEERTAEVIILSAL